MRHTGGSSRPPAAVAAARDGWGSLPRWYAFLGQEEGGALGRDEGGDDDGRRRMTSLVGLVFAVLLVALGLILMRVLKSSSEMQDCIRAGRSNCAPIETPAPGR